MPAMTTRAVGYGAGSKEFDRLNCVRALLGESGEQVVELCCNVDDMTPEDIGFAIDSFLKAGALDAGYLCMGMKKNRPGVVLSCLCREEQRDEMVALFFKNTSTIGIREVSAAAMCSSGKTALFKPLTARSGSNIPPVTARRNGKRSLTIWPEYPMIQACLWKRSESCCNTNT